MGALLGLGFVVAVIASVLADGSGRGSQPSTGPSTRTPVPSDTDSVAARFDHASHQVLTALANEQGRRALGNKEGDFAVWDEPGKVVYEARTKGGSLIEHGEIDRLGQVSRR